MQFLHFTPTLTFLPLLISKISSKCSQTGESGLPPPLVASRALGRARIDGRLGFGGGGCDNSASRNIRAGAGAVARATILRSNAAPKQLLPLGVLVVSGLT